MLAASRPPLYLLTGPEELLLHRAAEKVVAELRDEGDIELVDIRAGELGETGLPDLRTGSLFGNHRVVLIREAQNLPADASAALLEEIAGTRPDATVILQATGTGRIQRLARLAKELGGRVDIGPPRDWEERKWRSLVEDEFRRHGRRAEPAATEALLSSAGFDVAAIAEKVAQVAATAPPGPIRPEVVENVIVGVGSRGAFAVADAMCDRAPREALTLLRGVLEAGHDPVMVLGALAYRMRSLVAVAGDLEPRSVGLNVSAGQARRLKGVRRNFGPGELTRAYRALADADAELKGGELPAAFVLERAVVTIATVA